MSTSSMISCEYTCRRLCCKYATSARWPFTPGSFVEDDFSTQYSDMLYSMQTLDGMGYVYCLIEHQSSADEMMSFRLLRYSIAAMHRQLEQGNKKLPLVIPLLFYHGTQSPYPYSTCWLDCFHNPDVAQTLYCQPFSLADVTVIPDDEIKTHGKAALLEYVQKHIRARDINIRLPTHQFPPLELEQCNISSQKFNKRYSL